MSIHRSGILLLTALLSASAASAQTASTATIGGLVVDAQKAVVPGVTLALRDPATGEERTVTTNSQGRYLFANLSPSMYDLTVSLDGFKTVVVRGINAGVTRAIIQDVELEVGGLTEQVTVSARAEVQLQRQDAALGSTIDQRRITLLPNVSRDALALITLQPGVTPGGNVTGARVDQSAFSLDGIDVSDSITTGNRPLIPIPTDAIEEFRVTVANPNATLNRSAGGQAVFVTRRGTNQFSGRVYEYHQNSGLAANSWTNNRLGLVNPFARDNRFGVNVGGPAVKSRTFFFGLYEGRRNPTAVTARRIVPTASLQQGLLRFRDETGTVQTIDPRTFDPRGRGASPAVLELLRLYPAPNDFTVGDGLNTAGFTDNFARETRSNLGIVRVDHALTPKWRADGSLTFFNERVEGIQAGNVQLDLIRRTGVGPGTNRPRSLSAGLFGVVTPRLSNELRFGWLHNGVRNLREAPRGQVPGLNIAVDLAGTLLDEPVDVQTDRARTITNDTDIYQFIDNLNWSRGAHTIQAGVNIRHTRQSHYHEDKLIGSLATPVALLGSATFNAVPASQRPAFIRPSDIALYNQLYAALLGQVESVGFLETRNAQLQPNPIGTGLITNYQLNGYEMYGSDTWRMTPSLTLSYGLSYQWENPPAERDGLQTLLVLKDSGQVLNPQEYLDQRLAAAERGEVFNPDLAYLPVRETDQHVYRTDWTNLSPRLAAAWNPSVRRGVLGRLLGDRQGVLRGGYSLIYDRQNSVQSMIIPKFGVGFWQTLTFNGPRSAAGDAFRAGIDGPIPLPSPTGATSPIVPAKPFGETLSFVVDPFLRTPRNHMFDLTLQRTLPGNLLAEVGYVGRLGRRLYQSININQVPYTFSDPRSGQTFAQAFDAVADQLRGGVAPAAVTPQPWFENLLVNLTPGAAGSRTAAMATQQVANIVNGNLSSLFVGFIDAFAAQPFTNRQVLSLWYRSSLGHSDYHAFVSTLRKRYSNGLAFDLNYTFSRSRDLASLIQNSATLLPNAFSTDVEFAVSEFDLTHVLNANWVYELPFGQGRRFATRSNPVVSKIVSGWYTAGIVRATSGLPLTITQGTQVWGAGAAFGPNTGAVSTSGESIETGLFRGRTGSGGVGVGGNPATGGSGLNIFADPEAVFRSVRRVRVAEDQKGGRNAIRGPGFWQVDLTIGKTTHINDRMRFHVTVDLFNAFNHVNFDNPVAALQSPATFGVITTQRVNEAQGIFPRRLQLGARVEF